MDHAEVSLNANGGAIHGLDAHRKALGVDRSDLDSGFAENWSLSQTTASTSGLSSSGKFSMSFKRSVDLETISENQELKDLQNTPTTRSIRYLKDFHINTPQLQRNQIETTPKKANYFAKIFDSASKSDKKKRLQSSIRWSSPKLSMSGQRLQSFQETLFESPDENYENIFSGNSNVYNQSIGVSPIKPHNTSNIALQSDKSQAIQRHPSGIESSTPKTSFKRTRTQTIVKAKAHQADDMHSRLLRKTQSFSPRRAALRETNIKQLTKPIEPLHEIDELTKNPAKKVLEFTDNKFNQLIGSKGLGENHQISTVTSQDFPKRGNVLKIQTRLTTGLTRTKSVRPIAHMPSQEVQSLSESDILATLSADNETDSRKLAANDDNLMDISDSSGSSIKTPRTNCTKAKAIHSDTPIRSDCVKRTVRVQANRTPTKRLGKSTSYNFTSVKSSPEKEKFDIVYGHLPCTLPKSFRRPLKRTASSRVESPLLTAPSAKRKLYGQVFERGPYFNGVDKLDILTQLKRNSHGIVEKIVSYLPDKSLHAVYNTSKSWREIIDDNQRFRVRRRKYVKSMVAIKENVNQTIIKPINESINNNNNSSIKPLHVHNLNHTLDSFQERSSVVVSPSTQLFIEHQNIVKNLEPDQRVVHCPRCNGASIVYPATANEPKSQRRSPRRPLNHSSVLQDRSLRSTTGSAAKRSVCATKVVVSEYASCSKKGCAFQFCTNCFGNRHINAKCSRLPIGSSPRSDEESPYKVQHRNPKKSGLKRLGRLKF